MFAGLSNFLGALLRIDKALDPNKPKDYAAIVAAFRAKMKATTGKAESGALNKALDHLDADWKDMNAAGRARAIAAAKAALEPGFASALPKINAEIEATITSTAAGAKAGTVKKYGLGIAADLSTPNRRALQALAFSQGNFVRDEYGKRSDLFGMKAKEIVTEALARGLGSKEIGKILHRELRDQQINRSRAYWNVVASSFVNRARTYANISSYQEAGITRYTLSSVLDERTSEVCRFMNGKSFAVADAIKIFNDVEEDADPENIKERQPWVRASGGQLWIPGSGGRTVVADVTAAGYGEKDRVGTYSNTMNDGKLASRGVLMPPFHGHCRTTVIPEVTTAAARPRRVGAKPPPATAPTTGPGFSAPEQPTARSGFDVADVAYAASREGLAGNLADAFKRREVALDKYNGDDREASEKDARMAMRAFLQQRIGAESVDTAARDRSGNGKFQVKADEDLPGAYGAHGWDGRIMVQKSVYENMRKAVGKLQNGETPSFGELKGLHTFVHEEVHGFSRISPLAYRGAGVGMEEAKTEIVARLMMREMLGSKTPDARAFALPKVIIENKKAAIVRDASSTHFYGYSRGSYDQYIGQLLCAVVDAGVKPERAGKVVEDSLLQLLRLQPTTIAYDGKEHIEWFVGVLAKNGEITDKAADKLAKRLGSSRNGFSEKKHAPLASPGNTGPATEDR